MPCGNASLKRWAKGRAERHRPDLAASGFPLEPHPKLHVTARAEGQIALLSKGQARGKNAAAGSGAQPVRSKGREGTIAPGTSRPRDLVPGVSAGTMSCSDKIARWSYLGVQGALLAHWLVPIYIDGVVVGRKFSYEHARRGLCCRLEGAFPRKRPAAAVAVAAVVVGSAPTTEEETYRLSHLSLMGTSVKLDDKCIEVKRGARFDSPCCLVWSLGDEEVELIDGPTGSTMHEGRNPLVSRRALFGEYAALLRMDGEVPPKTYAEAKVSASKPYRSARHALIGGPFSDWAVGCGSLELWGMPKTPLPPTARSDEAAATEADAQTGRHLPCFMWCCM